MKKNTKIKRILSFILTVCILFGAAAGIRPSNITPEVTAATIDTIASQYEYKVSAGTLTYTVANGEATITGFNHSNTAVTTVDIPSTLGGYPVRAIGEKAFYQKTSLTSVKIPDGVTSIGEQAFYYCISLTSVKIPDSVIIIEDSAFYDCRNITDITIPKNVKRLGTYRVGEGYVYRGVAFTSITIPSSLSDTGRYTFTECYNLTNVTISDGVKKIGLGSFTRCTKLASIVIPESVTTLDEQAFWGCTGLNSIFILNPTCSIYSGVDTINNSATIYGYTGSTAQTYANTYGRNFVPLDGKETNITFNQAGGSGGTESITAITGDAMPEITIPSKTGCKFLGYYDAESGGTKYYNADGTSAKLWDKIDENVTLYAQWKLADHAFNYVHKLYLPDSGAITDLPKTPTLNKYLPTGVDLGDVIDLSGKETTSDGKTIYHAPTCDGYVFMGWYSDADLTTLAYQNGETITVEGPKTLYAKWIPVGKIKIAKGDIYTLEREIGTNKAGFDLYGVQIRFKDYTNGGKGMRFVTRVRTALLDEIKQATGNEDVSYGYLMKTQTSFADPTKCNYDPLKMVEFEANLNGGKYADFGDYFLYTGVITNIKEEKFDTNFSAAAYIKYTDANGVERRHCFEEKSVADYAGLEYKGVYHTNLRRVAEACVKSTDVWYTPEQQEYLDYIINNGK